MLDLTAISDGQDWHRASGRAIAIVTGDRGEILAGQAVEAAGQLALIAPPLNPGRVRLSRVSASPGNSPAAHGRRPGELLAQARRAAVRGCGDCWAGSGPGAGRGCSSGSTRRSRRWPPRLLLGQREGIEPEVNDAFARTGTTHLLAISGLQLQALALALLLVFRVAGVPPPAGLSGRAAGDGRLRRPGRAGPVGRALDRHDRDVLPGRDRAAAEPARQHPGPGRAGTLAVNPLYLFDVGCQLSFLAIGALIWLVPPAAALRSHVHRRASRPVLRSRSRRSTSSSAGSSRLAQQPCAGRGCIVIDGVVASAVVWLAALPLVALRFHLVSPIGILLNIPLIPVHVGGHAAGRAGSGALDVWGPLGGPLALGRRRALLKLTKAIVLWGVAQPWGHRFVVGPAWGWVLVFYVLLGSGRPGAERNTLARRSHARRSLEAGPWWLLAAWVAPGWLLPAALASRAGDPRGRIPGGRAWPGGVHPDARRPSLPLRLRAAGRPDRRPPDHRAGALGARRQPDRRGLPEPCRPGPLQRPARPARPVPDRRGAHPPGFRRRGQSGGRSICSGESNRAESRFGR